jgi:hypothetical protein
MKLILTFIKTALGGGSTKIVIYGLFLVAFIALLFKAYNVTKEVHYKKYVLPHVMVVRDSLSIANYQIDSVSKKYWKLQDEAVQDSVINRDLIYKLQVTIKQSNDRVKALKGDCRDIILIREKYGVFGGLKSKDSTIIIK